MTARRATWGAAALAVLGAFACGGDAGGPRQIRYDASYWTEAGEVPAPGGFDHGALRVRQLDASGRLVDVELEWDGDTAIVPESARPPLYVSYGADMVVTDFEALDVGRRRSGRPDLEYRDVMGVLPTDVQLSGLDPDAAGGGLLYLSVPNAHLDAHLGALNVFGNLPADGATEASFLIEFPQGYPIVDASRGDRTHVYQMSHDATFSTATLTRHAATEFSLADGLLSAELMAVEAGERLELSYETAAFAAMVDDIQPDAGPLRHSVSIVAHTGPAELATGTSATLAARSLLPQDAEVGAADLPHGNPFGDGWRELAVATSYGEVALVLDDRPLGVLEVASTTVLPVDEAQGVHIAPTLSAPRNPSFDGAASGPQQLAVAGDQVVLAWEPPHLGAPSHYVVEIFDFGFGTELLGTVVTRDTQVVLSGAQLPGDGDPRAYRVSAVSSECPVESRPFDQPMVRVEAQVVTGVVVRP